MPGIVAAWLWVAPQGPDRGGRAQLTRGRRRDGRGRRLAWPLLDVADARVRAGRTISGTDDNSIWSLILGYNGLGRLSGQAGGPAGATAGAGPGTRIEP